MLFATLTKASVLLTIVKSESVSLVSVTMQCWEVEEAQLVIQIST